MKIYLFCVLQIITMSVFAIVPPVTGVKTPVWFEQNKNIIQSSYNSGFYAEKFSARKLFAEKIERGELKNTKLVSDTVFALTLLGNYANSTNKYSAGNFQTKLFDGPNPTGTITQYYKEISYNQLHFTGNVKGWFSVPGTMASYVGSNNGMGSSGGPRFVYELIVASDSAVNFANYIQYYDANNTPHIGFVAAVHSGADAAAGANNIWSHRWSFRAWSGSAYTTNDTDPVSGKKVIIDGDYAIQPEMKGASNSGGALIDIGVFAHEFGHIFGLPDLYDTDNTSEGIGNWCLMAGGAYGGNGQSAQSPSHMSAWCKQALGWVVPKVIDSLQMNFSISPSETSPDVLKVWKHGAENSKEYFLIENRQLVSFDQYLPQDGVLIYHVDDNIGSNTNENHYKVDVEQADGRRDLNRKNNRGDAGDPFPGSTSNIHWTSNTNPNSNSYTAGPTYIIVKNITKSGDKYVFTIGNGTEPNLAINSVVIAENSMQNGRVEPGETGAIVLNVSNFSSTGYDSNTVAFRFSDPSILVLKPSIKFSLTAGQNKVLTIDSVFSVPEAFPPQMVYLYYTGISGRNILSDSLRIAIGIPKTIVISKAEKRALGSFYTGAFDSLGVLYEEVYNGSLNFASRRNAIVILSGKNKDTLFSAGEIDSLSAFVQNGGKLLLSGQNLGEFLHLNYPEFLHNVVGVNWIKNEGVFTRIAYKVDNDFMGEKLIRLKFFGGDGASNEVAPDVFYPYSSAFHPSLSYRTDTVSCASGWIKNNNGGKVFILGFGFESISNNESAITRNQAMGHILDWFNGAIANEKPVNTKTDFHVFQNYPNPFNPSTTIMFTIAERSDVVVTVYNSLGQVVAIINQGMLDKGIHRFFWQPGHLSSGVYYYRVKAGDTAAVQKMIYLK